ncbi:MAG TPA: PLP-dependent aminotransferase family protein, partial [Flavisolibacter sp.]|nr:PLP-dependent aminotransferase family protein [Flavisolibacter sp.]
MDIKEKRKELLYRHISRNLEELIVNAVYKFGEKLPSIRTICQQYKVSMSTALQAYYDLESKSMIEARPQSGYYISYCPKKIHALPETSKPASGNIQEIDSIIEKVYSGISNKNLTLFSLYVPSGELLPLAKLNKGIVHATRTLPDSGTSYEPAQGNEKLRRQIAKRSFQWEGHLNENDIITTNGCSNAISFCLMALTRRGDTIAVESPVYFGLLQLALNLGLKVVELPTHAKTGVELEALNKALSKNKIKACILVSNFNNPLGSCMPDEHKKEVVRLLEFHNIPLIEDDLYGDLYFGDNRPKSCKTYDQSGLVLWCGSASKTIAPGYRVGWLAPGKFKHEIVKIKFFHSLSSTTITHEVIADFLENGRYENHLKKLRRQLEFNYKQYTRAIAEYFPADTKLSRPEGGLGLWVELNKKINTIDLYESAIRQKISIAPGRMFTLQKQFDNCMRLSFGITWSSQLENKLKTLGK